MSHQDDSTAVELPTDAALDLAELPAPGTSTLAVTPGTAREIHGQVVAIKTGLLDQPSYLEIRDQSGLPRRLAFRIPPAFILGVRVGDQVTARVRLDFGRGRQPSSDGLLLDAMGRLVISACGSGDDDFAPGFQLTHDGDSNAIVFSRAGSSAVVRQGDWRRLDTKDGEFLLTSSAPRSMTIPGIATSGTWPFCILRIT